MRRAAMFEEGPPPSYESAMGISPAAPLQPPYVPPRYLQPTGGRNSICYSELQPLYDTTKVYLVDNKSADVASLNYQNDHSDFLTTVIQNNDFSPNEASTQTINLDNRSNWGGDLKTILHTNMPNVNEFMFTNSFKARVMVARDDKGVPKYEWVDFTLPEGNYSETMTLDLMNNAIVEHYLKVGRQNGVKESDIGVKFDTRNFRLGWDPETGLIMPGVYTNEAFHPDIVLLPGCGVDFTQSRLSNLLGVRKRQPFQEGFKITYEDLEGGNIPALLDLDAYEESLKSEESGGGAAEGGEEQAGDSGTASVENESAPVAEAAEAAALVAEPETVEEEDMNDSAIRGDSFIPRGEEKKAEAAAAVETEPKVESEAMEEDMNDSAIRGDTFVPRGEEKKAEAEAAAEEVTEAAAAAVAEAVEEKVQTEQVQKKPVIKALTQDSKKRSYNLIPGSTDTEYRSWYLAYNYGDPVKGVRSWTLLCTPDVTCGSEQMYWSLPNMMQDPVTFRSTRQVSNFPVVGAELLPVHSKSFYNEQAVYSQLIRQATSLTHVFNRFPENQILARPPAPTITTVSENVPALTDHGTLPLRNSISGVQRVTITDARRRTCPYVYKALGIVSPRVLSSRTF
nr:III [Human mastadenovirus C]